MFFDYAVNIGDIERNIAAPYAIILYGVYGFYPFVEGFSFSSHYRAVLTFCFENKDFTIIQFYKIIGIVFAEYAVIHIADFKTDMVILYPCFYARILF